MPPDKATVPCVAVPTAVTAPVSPDGMMSFAIKLVPVIASGELSVAVTVSATAVTAPAATLTVTVVVAVWPWLSVNV